MVGSRKVFPKKHNGLSHHIMQEINVHNSLAYLPCKLTIIRSIKVTQSLVYNKLCHKPSHTGKSFFKKISSNCFMIAHLTVAQVPLTKSHAERFCNFDLGFVVDYFVFSSTHFFSRALLHFSRSLLSLPRFWLNHYCLYLQQYCWN